MFDDKGESNRIYDVLAWIPTSSSCGIMCFDFQPPKQPNDKRVFATCSTLHPVYFQSCEQRATLCEKNTLGRKYKFPSRYAGMLDKMPNCDC